MKWARRNLLFLFFIVHVVSAQQLTLKESVNFIGVDGGIGFLIPHRPVMKHLPQKHVHSMELVFNSRLNGFGLFDKNFKYWHSIYGFPTVGLSFLYTESGNREVLGSGFAVLANAIFHPYTSNRLAWNIGGAIGPGLMTKNYDKQSNPKNNAIGSNWNICAKLFTNLTFQLEKWRFNAGLSFIHFSNMATKLPNLGLNLPRLDLGFAYVLAKPSEQKEIFPFEFKEKWESTVLLTGGYKSLFPTVDKKYGAYSLQIQLRRFLNEKTSISLGLDFMYSSSRLAKIEFQDNILIENKLKYVQNGLNIGYNKMFGRLTFFLQTGVYVYDFKGMDGAVYNRIGGYYRCKNWLLHGAVKTHLGKADYFELGIGHLLWRRQKK